MPSATHLRLGLWNTCVFDDNGRVECHDSHPVELGPAVVDIRMDYGGLCALYDGGGVRCWDDWVEELGETNGELLDLPPVQKISMGDNHAAFLLVDGSVVTMGENTYGQVLPRAFTIEPIALD